MPEPKVLVALCLVAVIVLGVNAMLLGALRAAGRKGNAWELMQRAGKTALRPWAAEDAQLEELSRRVAELKSDHVSKER